MSRNKEVVLEWFETYTLNPFQSGHHFEPMSISHVYSSCPYSALNSALLTICAICKMFFSLKEIWQYFYYKTSVALEVSVDAIRLERVNNFLRNGFASSTNVPSRMNSNAVMIPKFCNRDVILCISHNASGLELMSNRMFDSVVRMLRDWVSDTGPMHYGICLSSLLGM